MGEFWLRATKLKISSVSTHFMDRSSESAAGFEFPLSFIWIKIKLAFYRLDRLLTAISYAEAGNLDAVQAMIEQNALKVQ